MVFDVNKKKKKNQIVNAKVWPVLKRNIVYFRFDEFGTNNMQNPLARADSNAEHRYWTLSIDCTAISQTILGVLLQNVYQTKTIS